MTIRITPIAVALLLLVAACSFSDPTASNDYTALEQELAQANQNLARAETTSPSRALPIQTMVVSDVRIDA